MAVTLTRLVYGIWRVDLQVIDRSILLLKNYRESRLRMLFFFFIHKLIEWVHRFYNTNPIFFSRCSLEINLFRNIGWCCFSMKLVMLFHETWKKITHFSTISSIIRFIFRETVFTSLSVTTSHFFFMKKKTRRKYWYLLQLKFYDFVHTYFI